MEKHLHSGHRQRLKNRYLDFGVENLSDHEILELLLFYAIPQRNTNDIAHTLIDKFGSLRGVLEADIDSLKNTKGLGEHSAILITLLNDIHRKIRLSENEPIVKLDSLSKIGKYLMNYYEGIQEERVTLMLFDNSMRLIDFVVLSTGSINSSSIDYRSIAEISLRKNAACVVLAHNHPNGLAIPSSEDRLITKNVDAALSVIGVHLIEHIIVGTANYAPTMQLHYGSLRAAPTMLKIDENFFSKFYSN